MSLYISRYGHADFGPARPARRDAAHFGAASKPWAITVNRVSPVGRISGWT